MPRPPSSESGQPPSQPARQHGFDSPIIGAGYRYWLDLCAGRPFPLRADIDPATMPRHLLPHVVLVDVLDTTKPDFRWRLIGTHTTDIMGRDATGKVWSRLYSHEDFFNVSEGPRHVLATGEPFHSVSRAPLRDREFILIESVDLPLSSDGREIDMILGFNDSTSGYNIE